MGPSKTPYSLLKPGDERILRSSQSLNANERRHAIFSATLCQSIVLLFLIFLPIVIVFCVNFVAIQHEDEYDDLSYENRAELYSIDELLHSKRIGASFDSDRSRTKTRNKKFNIVCYYNYPENNTSNLHPEDIPCDLCTHIIAGFAFIANHTISLDDRLIEVLPKVVELKKCNGDLKILLTVGGPMTDNGFPDMVLNHARRKEFIKSLKSVLISYKLDGVDLDWEFPVFAQYKKKYNMYINKSLNDKRQRQHFTQLLREIRMEFIREKKDYILSVAVAAPQTIVDVAYDVEEMNRYVDFVNIMTYDFHAYSKYTPFTGFNSPLYNKSNELFYLSTLNINYTAYLWLNKGMDRNKIMIGLPTYGHSFSLMNSNNVLPGSPANGFGRLGDNGFVNLWELCGSVFDDPNTRLFFDNETFSPYLVSKSDWVSYESMESIISKSSFIKDNDFGGAMVYSLNSDDFMGKCSKDFNVRFYLTNYVKNTLLDNDL